MKKIFLGAACLLALASCDMDINDNPNYPSGDDVQATLQFPAAENALAVVPGDALFNYCGFFVQYWDQMPEANQYNKVAELNFDESSMFFNSSYSSLYAGALMDINDIQSKTTNTENLFACAVVRAQAFMYMVDAMSDAPYTEALQGNANPQPKWDYGETILKGLLKELDDAEAAIQSGDDFDMNDPIFNGDIDRWKQYANLLRLRICMRLIDGGIDASTYTAKAQAIVAENNLPADDITFDVYSNAEGQYNPWYGTYRALSTHNHCAAYPLVTYMKKTGDPRISYAIKPATATKEYVGAFPGSKQMDWNSKLKNTDVSQVDESVAAGMPIYLSTLSEVCFLKAEVELRFNGDAAAAKTDYEAGVTADFNSREVTGAAAFLANSQTSFDAQSTTADKLNLLYMQRWVAFFFRNHFEAWCEQRRTDVPCKTSYTTQQISKSSELYTAGQLFSPGLNYKGNGDLCKRFPYPSTARQLNHNTPAVKTLADPVFWDVK